jgi:hypothetical protein
MPLLIVILLESRYSPDKLLIIHCRRTFCGILQPKLAIETVLIVQKLPVSWMLLECAGMHCLRFVFNSHFFGSCLCNYLPFVTYLYLSGLWLGVGFKNGHQKDICSKQIGVIFTLMMNKTFIRASKILREMAMAMIWFANQPVLNAILNILGEVGAELKVSIVGSLTSVNLWFTYLWSCRFLRTCAGHAP